MDAQYFLEEMIDLQQKLHDYLDGEKDFQEISEIITDFKRKLSMKEMTPIIRLIVKISNNYHRSPNFFDKIFQILNIFKTDIQQTFTNFEIFKLFKSNKRILLFLIEESILKFDQSIIDHINENKYWNMSYIKYFLIESKPFISIKLFDEIKKDLHIENDDYESFKERRRIGENDEYISELIRNDLIDDFIVYINRTNTSHSKIIKHSIFETNLFLTTKNPTLIEYSAFFGSFQIFKYLQLNNVDIDTSMWLYAIHGNNPEIIHILEENQIKPFETKCSNNQISYETCFNEAIKCHCNDIALYIQNNYLMINQQENDFRNIFLYYKYQNYFFFDKDLSNLQQLKYLIEYHYDFLAIKILNKSFQNINELLISLFLLFNEISMFLLF